LVYRARRSEARIQQMLWKINYSDVVFFNTVGVQSWMWFQTRYEYKRGVAWLIDLITTQRSRLVMTPPLG